MLMEGRDPQQNNHSFSNFKCSAAAADPLVGQVLLVVDMTLRGVDMTLQGKTLEGQNWGSCRFSGPGTFKKRFPGKNDVEWYPQK